MERQDLQDQCSSLQAAVADAESAAAADKASTGMFSVLVPSHHGTVQQKVAPVHAH